MHATARRNNLSWPGALHCSGAGLPEAVNAVRVPLRVGARRKTLETGFHNAQGGADSVYCRPLVPESDPPNRQELGAIQSRKSAKVPLQAIGWPTRTALSPGGPPPGPATPQRPPAVSSLVALPVSTFDNSETLKRSSHCRDHSTLCADRGMIICRSSRRRQKASSVILACCRPGRG